MATEDVKVNSSGKPNALRIAVDKLISGLVYPLYKQVFSEEGQDPIHVSEANPLPVSNTGGVFTAFGDQSVAEEVPLIQLKFPYGINSRLSHTHVNNALGSVTSDDSMGICSTGASASSLSELFSRIPAEYQPGTGISSKFTTLYSIPAAGSEQFHGIGEPVDGYFFGYLGTDFGVHILSNGAQHTEEFEITAAATGSDDITITLDGDAKTVAITAGDTEWDIVRKIAATSSFSTTGDGWDIFANGKHICFRSFTAGVKAGAFSYGAGTTGSTATLTTELAGVATTVTTFNQADWNLDTMLDGSGPSGMTLDHTKLNVYKIQFQFLGAGAVEYFVESDTTGQYIKVHRINYANNNILPSVRNPTLPLRMSVKNTSNSTDIVMKTGSMSAFAQGKVNEAGIIFGVGGDQAIVANTEELVFGLHLPPVFNGVASRVIVRPIAITLTSDGTKSTTFKIYRDPVFEGSPVFGDVATGLSPMHFTTTPGVNATGTVLARFTLGKVDSTIIDMAKFGIEGVTGSALAITAESAGTSDVSADLTYKSFQ